ncbi:metabotropic glutamate receptor 3 isoform X1 [Hydra vulgaris]|uniref:metabotropic glutamate receptor 3 isoform X1 n=1 Tax=Hydra vulgaris TaxID=6087 RepID=UPI0006414E54|nr:metabotropic glutamate receptor 3 [Hydra vulgaris]
MGIGLFMLLILPVYGNVIKGSGSFLINGIFPISNGKNLNMQSGFMMYQAMKYAVNMVNNNSDFLHGYKLKVNEVFDVNDYTEVQSKVLATFMNKVPFLIGPYSGESSFLASILTSTFSQIAISYSASYSEFDILDHKEQKMFRTVPSSKFRIQIALDLIKKLKWNYVIVISSNAHDGEDDSRPFIAKLPSIGTCIDIQIKLPVSPSKTDYEAAIKKLSSDGLEKKWTARLKGLILFTSKKDTAELFSIIKAQGIYNQFVMFCFYGCTNYVEITKGNEDVINGTLSLDIANEKIPGFEEHYLNLRPSKDSDYVLNIVWETYFKCSLFNSTSSTNAPCTGNEQFSENVGYYSQTPVHTVAYAIYAIADALEHIISRVCHRNSTWMKNKTQCVIQTTERKYNHNLHTLLNKMSYLDGALDDFRTPFLRINRTIKYEIHQFLFNDGKYQNLLRATWELNRPNLKTHPEDALKAGRAKFTFIPDSIDHHFVPVIVCSDPCPVGYIKIKDFNSLKSKCCWDCQKCQPDSISVNDSCIPCNRNEKVESNQCVVLPEVVISLTGPDFDKFMVICIILIAIGLGLVFFVIGLFIYFNGNRIVRCSGRDLCYMILIGLAMLFFCPVTYMVRPSTMTCIFRGALPGTAFLMCYAPLFLRASRIYRIFIHAKTSVSRPALISPQSQVFVVLGIVCVQILLASVWFASKNPAPDYIVSPERDFMIVQCTGDASAVAMLINLTLSVVFMVCCTILAFKTRNFPKNYNEAKFIGVTLYITCVIWSIFLPTYYLNPEKYLMFREKIVSGLCILIGYVTLIGLFGRKLRLLLCPRPSDEDVNNQQMWSFSHSNESHHLEIK